MSPFVLRTDSATDFLRSFAAYAKTHCRASHKPASPNKPMHHHLRIIPPRGIITHALNKGGKSAPARLLITKLKLYPRKPRELLTRACNLVIF